MPATALPAIPSYDAVLIDGHDVYWVEGRPDVGDMLMRRSPGAQPIPALPADVDIGTTIYGYGGGAYTVAAPGIFACHNGGRSIALVSADRVETTVTGGQHLYGDLFYVPWRRLLLAVRESIIEPQTSQLVAITGGPDRTVRVLAETAGFYAAPRASPDGRWVSWLSWQPPDMPWDATTLWVAPLNGNAGLGAARIVAGHGDESICCPTWSPAGELYFVSDRSGWWNLYRARDEELEPVVQVEAELGVAQWELGYSTYVHLAGDRLAVIAQRGPRQELLVGPSGELHRVGLPYTSIKPYLGSSSRKIALIGASSDQPPTIALFDPTTGAVEELASPHIRSEVAAISHPEPFTFPTRDGQAGYGLYYPPRPGVPTPPLIIRAHPGPTANTNLRLDATVQFFTSNGFALADVDYRGSTGYGRIYRHRLRGQWGILDAHDCIDAARHLASTGKADARRMVITGASAGGYTALSALTQPDQPFAAATARSAIIDPITWRTTAPRFQRHHTDRLIGPWPEAADTYRERSIFHNARSIRQPVLLLHGDTDPIAPIEPAAHLATALRRNGTPCDFIAFPNEGHGLGADAISRALTAELNHYRRVAAQ